MRIRFWGTRGSIAKPGPSTFRYGGNTSCVEIISADGQRYVCDAGTGAHGLGQALLKLPQPVNGHLFISHTHWDHIQGIPFFAPLFMPGNTWDIYGPTGLGKQLEETLSGQMEYQYFPVRLTDMAAKIRFHELNEGELTIGSLTVKTRFLNHPSVAMGYRFEGGGRSVVYATDHEPHLPPLAGDVCPLEEVHAEDAAHVNWMRDADVVIHDSQYTLEEYPSKRGWGHTPAERAVEYAIHAKVKHLILFHHDPMRDDEGVARLLERCRHRASMSRSELRIDAAAEGSVMALDEPIAGLRPDSHPDSAHVRHHAHEVPPTVLIAEDDPGTTAIIQNSLAPDGYRLIICSDGETALRLARTERPDLILIDWHMPRTDGLAVCRELRQSTDQKLREVPIVLLTATIGPENTTAGFAAGATDYLTKPVSPAYLRSRIKAWLLRQRTEETPAASRS